MTNEQDNQGLKLSRRNLLEGVTLTGAALALGGVGLLAGQSGVAATAAAAGGAALSAADFLSLSIFLTGGQPLNPALASRYQAALQKRDPQFTTSAQALLGLINTGKPAHVDALLAAPELQDPLRALMSRIVSAWYLGIVGQDADAELISYANALMYRPTQDMLVIPTYGAGPDSWGEQPSQSTAATTPATTPATKPATTPATTPAHAPNTEHKS
ncbi:Membrane bound FAD containing D-sorbitol dehydrogenase [Roseateles sp. YR242]|uniref:sugar dehydrogenase complex small subunit n=1 Tax=Roseateles sp. YR242 TaxID=1855305 RepID=UPI0008BC35E8|nr:sugar dehydrogenase complex small subunit [Roseateles sp. YR242]SEK38416.1 Membrane bound FAD containing D-sorbitol dehydrogenase [Roseateles sp. YR242]